MMSINSPSAFQTPKVSSLKRKSLVTSTPIVVEPNNDDIERLEHRKSIVEQTRLNNSIEENYAATEAKSMSLDKLEHFLETFLRMSAENKITTRNVWQIQVIQYLDMISNKASSNNLQVASAGLDVSAKVYGLRVDSVYTNAIKIAGDLSRQFTEPRKSNDQDDDDVENDGDDGETNQRKKKKVKKNKKAIIVTPESITGTCEFVETMEPVFAQITAKGSDINASECLFQVVLNTYADTCKLSVMSEVPFWDASEVQNRDDVSNTDKKCYISKIPSIENTDICPEMATFSVTDWTPEDEKNRLHQEEEMEKLATQTDDCAFDMNATPLPIEEPLDQVNPIAMQTDNNSSDEEVIDEVVENNLQLKRRVEHVVDMRPTFSSVSHNLEYSYNTIVSGIWAGPAHWKIKSNMRKSTATGAPCPENANSQKKKVKRTPKALDYTINIAEFDLSCDKNKRLKRETLQNWLSIRNTLPTDLHVDLMSQLTLCLHPYIKINVTKESESPNLNVDETIPQYDYNNPNDSNFCVGVNNIEHDNDQECFDEHDDINQDGDMDIPLTGDNLIAAPAMVPRVFLPYAVRAKRVDMKKLKAAVLKIVNETIGDREKENNNAKEKTPTKNQKQLSFSEIHNKLPTLLSSEMSANLSCALEVLAVLHIANENNLTLISDKNDLTGFDVKKI